MHLSVTKFRKEIDARLTFRYGERRTVEFAKPIRQWLETLRVGDQRLHLFLTAERLKVLQYTRDRGRKRRASTGSRTVRHTAEIKRAWTEWSSTAACKRGAGGRDYSQVTTTSRTIVPRFRRSRRMPTRTATASWKGGLKGGTGSFKGQTGLGGSYSFGSRFENASGSNPEELLAAA